MGEDKEIGKLPEGWKMVRLGELGEFKTSSVDKKIREKEIPVKLVNYMDVYKHNFITKNLELMEVTANKHQSITNRVIKGDVLFTPTSETPDDIGHSAVVLDELRDTLYSYHLVRLRFRNNDLFDIKFKGYVFNSRNILHQFEILSTGVTRFTLSKKDFEEVSIDFPESKFEQHKIAEIFETVDNAIDKTDRIIEKYKRIKQGLMQDLLTRGIDENGQIRSEETHKFKDLPLGRIPEEWGVSRIIDFSRTKSNPIQTGPFGAQLHAFEYVKDGVPLILIKNIFEGKIIEKNIPHILEEKAMKLKRYRLKSGDVIFSRVGNVGRCAVIKDKQNGWLISGQMLRVRLENPLLDPIFLSYMMDTVWFQKVLESEILGTTRKSINTDILSKLPIILPPLPEQYRIAEILSRIDETIEKEQKYKEKLERIKHGLMEDLLTGKVRVNHLIEESVENVSQA